MGCGLGKVRSFNLPQRSRAALDRLPHDEHDTTVGHDPTVGQEKLLREDHARSTDTGNSMPRLDVASSQGDFAAVVQLESCNRISVKSELRSENPPEPIVAPFIQIRDKDIGAYVSECIYVRPADADLMFVLRYRSTGGVVRHWFLHRAVGAVAVRKESLSCGSIERCHGCFDEVQEDEARRANGQSRGGVVADSQAPALRRCAPSLSLALLSLWLGARWIINAARCLNPQSSAPHSASASGAS